jgi:hypothetical protein
LTALDAIPRLTAQGKLANPQSVAARNQVKSSYKGVIYGTVFTQDGTPAKGLMLNAHPWGFMLATPFPWAKTNDAGGYRFEHLEWGRYTVFAEDKEAGYSMFITGAGGTPGHPPEVELTAEHPEAEFAVRLPPPAGFVLFHLTNRTTGTPIAGVDVTVMSGDITPKPIFGGGFGTIEPLLVPSDRDLLLHVKSWGFREWEESVGTGKHIRIAPGKCLTLDVQLDPSGPLAVRIPAADENKYRGIRDAKDWRNPYLIVRAQGIEMVGVSDATRPLTIDAALEILEALPDSSWPYGRVVAIQNIGIVSSEDQDSPTLEIRDKLFARLAELGVIVGLWPSA